MFIQYGHLIPAQVDRTSTSAWLYRHTWITHPHPPRKNPENTSTPTTHVKATFSCKVPDLWWHPCPGNMKLISWRAVVYCARDAHALSAEIKYRHCSSLTWLSIVWRMGEPAIPVKLLYFVLGYQSRHVGVVKLFQVSPKFFYGSQEKNICVSIDKPFHFWQEILWENMIGTWS